jgi:ribosomal protein S18 acetylase RimI-like enzyme
VGDADRLHEALRTMFETLCSVFDDARFERRDGYDFLLFPQVPLPPFNGVWPRDDAAASALAEALAEIAQLGLPYSVQVRRGLTPGWEEEARRLGLTAEEPIPGMVVRPGELARPEPEGLEILRVATADGLAQALAVAAAGFEVPADLLAPMYLLDVAALDGLAYYVGRVGGRDVSTSVGYTLSGTVGVFNVATPPEDRGRGYGAALTAEAVSQGFATGAALAWLQASAMGVPVYRALGFREIETYVLLTNPSPHV